jgi:dolichol-phosphate mannosyltransferase
MSQQLDLSIILPAYLEEENLRLLLPRVKGCAAELTDSFEIIVVDTQSPLDGTHTACLENNVVYLNRVGDNTYGSAIRTGIKNSKGAFVIFMDADGSHHPEFIKELYQHRKGADIVIASRYVQGGHTENSPVLILMSRVVNIGYSVVLNIKCKDVSNSFKLYNGDQLRKLELKCKNFDIVEEILFKAIKLNPNTSIKEIPFTFKQRMFGETKRNLFQFIFTYIMTLFRLRFFT